MLLYPDIVLRLTRVSDAVMDDGVTLLTTECGDFSVSGLAWTTQVPQLIGSEDFFSLVTKQLDNSD